MSTETSGTSGRTYRKSRRAELEAETRERITEATVELHGSIGPARTTVSAIAERAGVQRATVYRHFPDQASLFVACTQHWRNRNPAPDLSVWAQIRAPAERFRFALLELYAWYGRTEQMAELVRRDAATMPAMQPSVQSMGAYFDAAVEVLLQGRRERGARRRRLRAGVGHAVAFETWRSLVRRNGLSDAEAVRMMATLIGDRRPLEPS